MYWHNSKYVTVTETEILPHTFLPPFFERVPKGPTAEGVLNYFDKIYPVVSVMTSSPSLKLCPPAHTHADAVTHAAYTHCHKEEDHLSLWLPLWVKQGLPGLCSGQGSAFCVCHLQSKCTWTRTWGFLGNQPIEGQHNGDTNYPQCSKLLQESGFVCAPARVCECVWWICMFKGLMCVRVSFNVCYSTYVHLCVNFILCLCACVIISISFKSLPKNSFCDVSSSLSTIPLPCKPLNMLFSSSAFFLLWV